jgi:ferredoxin-NADP reductase/DMSO/TMAO reductase YedYZ heme-binding membrane subunit
MSSMTLPRTSTTAASPLHSASRRSRLTGDVALAGACLLLGALLAATLLAQPATAWASVAGWLVAGGAIAAVAGTYGVLVLLVLIARVPPLERSIGQERLVGWHRRLAPWALGLVGLHVYLTTLGYALGQRAQPVTELWQLVTTAPWVLPATAGLGLLVAAGVTSWRVARRRLRYQTWWAIHLVTYLGVATAFAHQINVGGPFLGASWARTVWIGLYVGVAALLLLFRVGLPVLRSVRHDLRVAAVVPESPDVVSVWLTGRDLDRLPARAGQYLVFRFLAPGLRLEGHPYSLSAPVRDGHLRITVKALGDGSAALSGLRPGTRALVEGPYGTVTAQRVAGARTVLIAAGVGITPLRALLEDLPHEVAVDVVFRARTEADLVLRGELDALTARRPRSAVHYLVGDRRTHPMDAAALRRLVPDLSTADVVVCGSAGFAEAVQQSLHDVGVPADRVHVEAFDDATLVHP